MTSCDKLFFISPCGFWQTFSAVSVSEGIAATSVMGLHSSWHTRILFSQGIIFSLWMPIEISVMILRCVWAFNSIMSNAKVTVSPLTLTKQTANISQVPAPSCCQCSVSGGCCAAAMLLVWDDYKCGHITCYKLVYNVIWKYRNVPLILCCGVLPSGWRVDAESQKGIHPKHLTFPVCILSFFSLSMNSPQKWPCLVTFAVSDSHPFSWMP